MDDAVNSPDEPNVNNDDDAGEPASAGITLEAYAAHLAIEVEELSKQGLTTIENPWVPGRSAVGIPYRRRDGSPFRLRIRQSLSGADSKGTRSLWDRREEKLGGLLYGLDQLPAKGCPVLLVDDEALCHVLWHHGFDAVAVPGAAGYFPKRDDPEIEDFQITVLAAPLNQTQRREDLLRRLTRSRHRKRVGVAQLEAGADLLDLHRQDRSHFVEVMKKAIAPAKPLIEVAPQAEPEKPSSGNGTTELEGSISDRLVTLAQRDGTFFTAEDGSAWADVRIEGRRETWKLTSRGFKYWLIHGYDDVENCRDHALWSVS